MCLLANSFKTTRFTSKHTRLCPNI